MDSNDAAGSRQGQPAEPGPGLGREPLSPEIREWLQAQTTDEEVLAGLKELEETGGLEFQDFVQELEQAARGRERTKP